MILCLPVSVLIQLESETRIDFIYLLFRSDMTNLFRCFLSYFKRFDASFEKGDDMKSVLALCVEGFLQIVVKYKK